jgi:polyhydroxybutyrate depolymerase
MISRRAAVVTTTAMFLVAGCSSSTSSSSGASSTTTVPAVVPTAPRTSTSAAPACARPHPPGQVGQVFTFQGEPRTYQLYVPRAYTGRTNVPVVFNFHGYGSNAVQQMVYGDFKPEADRDDFLIVAPDGQDPSARHFNLGGEPGLQNDVDMAGALLTHIESTLCVDARRVYATGMSDGGAMTSVLACAMSNRFAAFAAVAVIISCAGMPVPIMAFSGTADPIVPFNGGTVNCCGHSKIGSAPAAMADWARADRCDPTPHDVRQSSEVIRRTWSGCAGTSGPVFYIIVGGGHTWPGSIPVSRLGKTTRQLNASATIWRFFSQHARA